MNKRSILLVFLIVSLSIGFYPSVKATRTFNDGFESDSFDLWIGGFYENGAVTSVSSDYPHHGTYCARVSGLDADLEYGGASTSFSAMTTFYSREYVRFDNGLTSGTELDSLTDAWNANIEVSCCLVRQSGGNYIWEIQYYHPTVTKYDSSTFTFVSDKYYILELKIVTSTTIGEIILKVDDVEVITLTGLNTGASGITGFDVEAYNRAGNTNVGTVWWDCVTFADTPIGLEQQLNAPVSASITATASISRLLTLQRAISGSIIGTGTNTRHLNMIRGISTSGSFTATATGITGLITRACSALITLTSSTSQLLSFQKGLSASLVGSSSVTRGLNIIRGLNISNVLTATVTGISGLFQGVSAIVTMTSQITRALTMQRSNLAGITFTSQVARLLFMQRGLSSIIQSTATVIGILGNTFGISAIVTLTGSIARTISLTFNQNVSVIITTIAATGFGATIVTIAQGIVFLTKIAKLGGQQTETLELGLAFVAFIIAVIALVLYLSSRRSNR